MGASTSLTWHAPMSGRHARRMLAVLALLGAAAFPIYWMLVTSLTPSEALFGDRQLLPSLSRLSVYGAVFAIKPVATWLLNSAWVAIGTTVLSIALAVFPAYA